jgi:hypothetical protein
LQTVEIKEPVLLRLTGKPGDADVIENCYESTTATYAKEEVRHERVETVDFTVETKVIDVNKKKEILTEVRILKKEGSINLHDLAFPEEGEILDMKLSPSGKVLKAGDYSKKSIFFLDPIPLPAKAVKKNQVWKSKQTWMPAGSQIPMDAKLEAKWVDSVRCGNESCVVVDITGMISMPKAIEKKTGFDHKITGRYLFAPESGRLVWSEFVSKEILSAGVARAEVTSKMRSQLTQPSAYHIPSRATPSCPF